jgi:hypothetical protein
MNEPAFPQQRKDSDGSEAGILAEAIAPYKLSGRRAG